MSTRRQQLRNVSFDQNSTNAGLWLDKYIKDSTSEAQDKAKLVDEVASIKAPDIYEKAFNRWEAFIKTEELAHRARIGYATVVGRMAVGHGDDAVLETSVALHRTYGVPYIPGSALKGTAASFARNHLTEADWGKNSEAYKVLFGTDKVAGYITFHDGLLKPRSGREGPNGQSLHADVLTPHHSDYYMTGKNPPTDWDNPVPVPVPFLSATGIYLIALSAPPACREWLDKVLAILKLALSEEGIGVGAKTSSGYGRLAW